jgi:hypothetical protein
MNKLHLLIASAMLTVGILATPTAAAGYFKCEDKKGMVHVGDNVETSCKKLRRRGKDFVKKACKVKEPSKDGALPAMETCEKTCGTCNYCENFYSTFSGYVDNNIFTLPPDCIPVRGFCVGTRASVKPVPLYTDGNFTKEANVTLIAASDFVTNSTTLVQGAFIFEKQGVVHFSAISDIFEGFVEGTVTGGTRFFKDASGVGSLELSRAKGVRYEICLS